MLDDLKFIHQKDSQDALGVAQKQWQQLQHDFQTKVSFDRPINNVVLAGMGGSAWPGLFVQSWPGLKVPFEISRDYAVPKYVGQNTLVIASSYSGNTEETLASLADAEQKGAAIVIVTNGGQLAEIAKTKNLPLFKMPDVPQPRMSAFFFWAAFVQLFEALGLVEGQPSPELSKVGDWLKPALDEWAPTVPSSQNQAKQIAKELMGRTVIVYSGPALLAAANKWKICFNENSKNLSWLNVYPEFDHNEFIAWSGHPVDKPFAVVEIRSNLEHQRTQKRFEVSERLLSGQRPAPLVIAPKGDTLLQQIVWATALGDFVSLYLALLNDTDPTPIDLVEKLKKSLD